MMTTRRLKKAQLYFMFLAPSAITICFASAVWLKAPLPTLIMGFIISALAWYSYMTVPYQFDYEEGQYILFRSVLRTLRIMLQEIESVDCRKWNWGFVDIRCASGRIFLFRSMPGLKELIEAILLFRPSVKIRGSI